MSNRSLFPSAGAKGMVRTGFALLAVGALSMGAASQVTAQITAPRGGWWNPVVIQATQEAPQDRNGDNVGNILRDAVLGRPGEQGNARQDSRAPNARGRGNGNNQGNDNDQGNGN